MTTVAQALPLPELYYDGHSKGYFIRNDRGLWISISEGSAKRHLKGQGFGTDIPEGQALSRLDECVSAIQLQQDVSYAAPLAGYDAGLREINNKRILVTDSPRLIEPAEGEWPLLASIFEGMLNHSGVDQCPYLFGWLKIAITALRNRKWQPGQVLALAGPVHSAKSLCQGLITKMLGGRAAHPHQFMTGATTFNADLFAAEHLMIEDVAESIDIRKRRAFGAQIKAFSVNREQHCHGKNMQALSLTPFWRVTISLNDEPERLLVLPTIDEDIADKIILLKVERKDMPMPTGTADEQEAFWSALMGELPAFIHYLLHWEIPAALQSRRFGVIHYHHPELLAGLEGLAPEQQLMEIIDQVLFNRAHGVHGPWSGLAVELHNRLGEDECAYRKEAHTLLRNPVTCGTYLARLVTKQPDRVTSKRVDGRTYYTIQPPYESNPSI
jgi:hypothetical protein